MRNACTIIGLLLFSFTESVAQVFTDSNLPIVIINTDGNQGIPDEPGVFGSMKIIDRGEGQRNNVTDQNIAEFLNYNGRIEIELRGSSSQALDKKQYRLTTLKADNATNNNVSLLGMPQENDWVLNGLAFDASLMRDYLSYTLSRNIGQYAPRTKYCEVIINNNYRGLYILQEKVKPDDDRVNIERIDPDDNAWPEITGGYLTKADKVSPSDPVAWTMLTNVQPSPTFIHEFPKPTDITTQQNDYIKKWFEKLASSAQAGNTSFSNGYPSLIDIPSFLDFMLINELAANVDAYQFSTFFHKDKNGKLRAGPLWDLNLTYGNDLIMWGLDRSKMNTWQFDNGDNVGPKFWKDLFNNSDYKCYLAKRWNALTMDGAPLSLPNINALIDAISVTIGEAAAREQTRWGTVGTHATQVNSIKTFLQGRMNWISGNLGSASSCSHITTPPLVITRIMYHPNTSPSFADSGDQEFIEITNTGTSDVDLTGTYFSGTGFVFQFYPGATIPAGGIIQLANDTKTFADRHGFIPFGEFTRNLSNVGQRLTLADGFGNVIDEVAYSSMAPWPDANNNGYHIKLDDFDSDNSIASNWVATDEPISSNVLVVGVEDEIHSTALYPNPVERSFTLAPGIHVLSWQLQDQHGRLLSANNSGNDAIVVDMAKYARGLYFIAYKTPNGTIVKKVIKK